MIFTGSLVIFQSLVWVVTTPDPRPRCIWAPEQHPGDHESSFTFAPRALRRAPCAPSREHSVSPAEGVTGKVLGWLLILEEEHKTFINRGWKFSDANRTAFSFSGKQKCFLVPLEMN